MLVWVYNTQWLLCNLNSILFHLNAICLPVNTIIMQLCIIHIPHFGPEISWKNRSLDVYYVQRLLTLVLVIQGKIYNNFFLHWKFYISNVMFLTQIFQNLDFLQSSHLQTAQRGDWTQENWVFIQVLHFSAPWVLLR